MVIAPAKKMSTWGFLNGLSLVPMLLWSLLMILTMKQGTSLNCQQVWSATGCEILVSRAEKGTLNVGKCMALYKQNVRPHFEFFALALSPLDRGRQKSP